MSSTTTKLSACFVVVRFQVCLREMSTQLWWLNARKDHKEKVLCLTAARSCTNGSLSRLVWELDVSFVSFSTFQFERYWNSSWKLLCVPPNSSPVGQHFCTSWIFLSKGHEQLARCFHHESIIRRFEESSCYISSFVQQVDESWNLLTGLQSNAMFCLQAVYRITLGLKSLV